MRAGATPLLVGNANSHLTLISGTIIHMRALLKKTVPARELPPEWQQEGQFAPDEQVTVYVEPADPELASAASLEGVMDIIGRRAGERGLTEETLTSTLHER